MNNKTEQSKDKNKEKITDFSKGFCQYISKMVEKIPENCFSDTDWKDGYYSFSHTEIRKREFHNNKTLHDEILNKRENLLYERISLNGEDGNPKTAYLMEIGLWKNSSFDNGKIFEEISIERDDNGFFLQQWKLFTGKKLDFGSGSGSESEWLECYYKTAETKQGKGAAFTLFKGNELESIEIIIPEKRLHFFLTTGGIES